MSPAAPSVDLLLATYNGGRFLTEQLQSIERQTFPSWRLIARDDGSTDTTRAQLGEFRSKYPAAVQLVEDADVQLGPKENFARLLTRSTADYVLFCDQDDIWQPHKIAALLELARAHPCPEVPLLVHSDLEVVDRDLRTIAPSFWRYQFIRPERCQWSRLLVENVVTGCACLFNAALRRAALPMPREAMMHDRWVALVAAAAGEIRWLDAPTVRYRQHGANDTGAKRWGVNYWLARSGALVRSPASHQKILSYRQQAGALARHSSAAIPESTRAVLRDFADLDRFGYFRRVGFVRRHGILRTGALRNLMFLWNL